MLNMIGLITANYPNSFGALAEHRSVVTLPFGGRYRLIDFALSNMVNSGITTVGLITPYLFRSIIDHVAAGKAWNLNRKTGGLYIMPGHIAGMKRPESKFVMKDILQNRTYIDRAKEDMILLMSGNKIYNYNFAEIAKEHQSSGRQITMFYQKDRKCSFELCNYLHIDNKGKVTKITNDDSDTLNLFCDCMIINRSLMQDFLSWYELCPELDVVDIIRANIGRFSVYAHEMTGYVGHVENIADYISCNMDMLKAEVRAELFDSEDRIYTKAQDYAPTRYSATANVSNSIIPTGCQIEGTVENSIIFRGVKVAPGAVIKNSVLMQNCVIEKDVVLDHIICDKSVTVTEGRKMFGGPEEPYIIPKSKHMR